MNDIFSDLYAETYDSVYDAKDYIRETDAVLRLVSEFAKGNTSTNLDVGCDAALMMFNVLGYMTTNEDLLGALRSVRRHLDENGLFIFDIWCGPALMSSPPGDGTKKFSTEKGAIIRSSSGHIRGHDQCCDIAIRLQKLESDVIVESSEEFHRVRYYFPLEIDLALRVADFRVMAIRRFPEIDKDPDLDVWSAVVVAAAGRPSP